MCVQLYLRLGRYPPSCVKRIASGPLTTHQISAQSVHSFQRYRKGACTCTRTRVVCTPPLASGKRLTYGSLTTHQISAQSVQPFPNYEKGVRTFARAAMHHPNFCKKKPRKWVTNHIPNFSAIRAAVPEIRKRGHICTCARTHMQMHPAYDLCNMHRCSVSKHAPNLVTIGQAIPEL